MSAPYYSDDSVTLYHGDAFEYMATQDDGVFGAVITDPPYTERTHAKARSNRVGSGDRAVSFASFTDDALATALAEAGRLTKRWVVANLDYRHAVALDESPPSGLRCLRVGVWVKPNPMPQITGDRPGQGWEAIAFFHREGVRPRWNGKGRSGVWTHPVVQNSGHPTSKPVEMVGDWVRLFTDPGDVVLDPFAGSGTTLRAAKDNGRRAVGVEMCERYCELIAKRLAQGALDFGEAS